MEATDIVLLLLTLGAGSQTPVLVKDICDLQVNGSSWPTGLTRAGQKLYFAATTVDGTAFSLVDGTTASDTNTSGV